LADAKVHRRDPLGKRERLVLHADDDPNQLIAEDPFNFEAAGCDEDSRRKKVNLGL
jgi:hypothetical protein